MRYHFTPVRMATIKKTRNKYQRGCGEKGIIIHCWWECKLMQPLWKKVRRFLKILRIDLLLHVLALPPLDILCKEYENMNLEIRALLCSLYYLQEPKRWKQPKCPSIYEWIKKMHTGTITIKKNKILPHGQTLKVLS